VLRDQREQLVQPLRRQPRLAVGDDQVQLHERGRPQVEQLQRLDARQPERLGRGRERLQLLARPHRALVLKQVRVHLFGARLGVIGPAIL